MLKAKNDKNIQFSDFGKTSVVLRINKLKLNKNNIPVMAGN